MAKTPLILASASAQRKNLLKNIGAQIIVKPSRVEEVSRLTTGPAALVKLNALLKARDVASRLKSGIVIGADTIGYDGKGHVLGKPRTLKDARAMLKRLTRHPHWIYTGVAVVHTRTGREVVGFEKTKVFMQPLSDQEVRQYHRHTTPLDKAGGFDIEGRGGLFIHRIEGCYSNVIGLPMAKLRLLLKEMGVSLL